MEENPSDEPIQDESGASVDPQSNIQEEDPTKINIETNPGEIIQGTWGFIKSILSLRSDEYDVEAIRADTQKGIVFKGYNVWILMLSIVVASVGLNVNSTAVIIGAMLISPLMGPIRGIGFGVGTNDLMMLRESLKNFAVTVGISLFTSFLYFTISPIDEVTNELFGRTEPNFLDVVIAFSGGLAGIIAAVRLKNDTVIPGVAIATALMPPLCTAGYGLANGNWAFFLGASYLFLLNSLLIALSSVILIRYLRFPKREYLTPKIEKKVQNYIIIFMVVIIAPSGYLFYKMTKRSIFETNARKFVEEVVETAKENVMVFPTYTFNFDDSEILLEFPNAFIDSTMQSSWKRQLANYELEYADLVIRQGEDFRAYTEKMLSDYDNSNKGNNKLIDLLQKREIQIAELQDEIRDLNDNPKLKDDPLDLEFLLKGYRIDYPELSQIYVNRSYSLNKKGIMDTTYVLSVRFREEVTMEEQHEIKTKLSRKFLLELKDKTTSDQDTVRVLVQ